MGCSSSSANTTIEPSNTNDAPIVAVKGKLAQNDNSPNTAISHQPSAATPNDDNYDKLTRQQSRAEGEPKEAAVPSFTVTTNSGIVAVEPSTIPNTPVTMTSRIGVSAIDTNNAVNNNDLLSSPSLPSDRPLVATSSTASSSSNGGGLRPASATLTSTKVPTTPNGRRVASAGTLRHPVLASLGGPGTLSPIADTPATPTSPATKEATAAAPPSIATPARPTNKTDNIEEKKESTEGMALVAGEKVALRPIAASHQATLTKTAVNRQAMFIPWEKPALGKPSSSPSNGDDAARPTTSSGRKLAAVPPNLDRLMNKTHKPSKHKREQMAAAAAAAANGDGETKSKSGDLMIIGSAINNGNISDANKENKESNDDSGDEKKSKRPQPLKRRLAPLAPLKGVPVVGTVAAAAIGTTKATVPTDRPTTSSGRPTTSSGRPGTAHSDTVSAMRRDRDRASIYSGIMRQLCDDCNLTDKAAILILKLASIKPPATNFEMVKPKQPPAWEIRF